MMINSIARKLALNIVKYPKRHAAIVLLTALLGGLCCLKLSFDSSYEALLPANSPKLAMTDKVRNLTGGFRQLVLAIGGTEDQRLPLAEELAASLIKIPGISRVELKQPIDFFKERAIWLLPTSDLQQLDDLLANAIEESAAADSASDEDVIAAWERVNTFFDKYKNNSMLTSSYKTSSDGRYLFMTAIPAIKFSDMQAAIDLLDKINTAIAELEPQKRGVTVDLAGNLKIVEEQHHTMSRDLTSAAILALVLSILTVALFTKKPKAPLLVGLALITGISWTMAITALTIGHLNIITGFLVSVIVGLGIDFGIHIFIRYQEEMIKNPQDHNQAMVNTIEGLFLPTMTAAMTTVGTFFAFYFADFRGFSEFGLIAAMGVALTFVASFLLLPPLLLLFDHQPIVQKKSTRDNRAIITMPRAIVSFSTLLLLAIYGYCNLQHIEFKNDYKNLRGESAATAFLDYIDEEMGGSLSPTVFIFDNLDDTARAAAILRQAAAEQDPSATARILKVAAASDFYINNDRKEAVASLRERLEDPDLDEVAAGNGPQSEKLRLARQLITSQPWAFSDLPPEVLKRFSTSAGDKYLLYLWPHQRYEADYQAAAWEKILEKSGQQLTTAGIPHLMADETLILAWVYQLILHDTPKVLALAAAVTLLCLLLDFRSVKKTILVSIPLIVGMGMVFGLMRLCGFSLNMFNIIVLPSIIGIGIDNSIHIYHRYGCLGKGSLDEVIRSVGMASLLASVTTIIGFGSSLISHMPGLASLGSLAVIGLGATFVSAVVFFPALLRIIERK